ncbi:ABC transporter ATP-binding protein [Hyphobacterium sp. CCMP332]|nr:ABC transporter ATP-binding protein [Hyphobacterium sp. CCMP332]
MHSKDSLLSVKNLSVRYHPDTLAVNNISFSIKKSEILALTGESGSGKSSLAFAIPRLLADSNIEGEVLFDSNIYNKIDLLTCDSNKLSQILGNEISMVFQDSLSSLNPVRKCGIQIQETLEKHQKITSSESKKLVLNTLSLCQLNNVEKVYNSYPHELSGGQIQRVAIAIAIINKPSLLIADEITSNLDSPTRDEILNLLLKIKSELSLSILFVSHDIKILQDFSDEIIVLNKGNQVEKGPATNILSEPEEKYTKSLLSNSVFNKAIQKTNTNSSILSVSGLEIIYNQGQSFFFNRQKSFTAVDRISFKLKKGEILGLVGKSGSGKTSIGKAIVKLIKSKSGSIKFYDTPISDLDGKNLRNLRKSIQIIFQNPSASLDPRINIGYCLKEPFLSHDLLEKGESVDDKIKELLLLVGLDQSFAKRLPDELSGGEKQRVCIARALSLRPEILICDEALSSLDANIKRGILDLLGSLREKKGLSILFISHDNDIVEYFCDRILRLENGKIISEQ